ncbi:MAG: ABC transporter permease subunit [Thermoproteota archaeon]
MNKSLVIAKKEFSDAVTSKRFWLIVVLFLLLYIVNIYATSLGFRMGLFGPTRLFLQAGSSVVSTMSIMAPLLGVALAFSAISGEREKGTLKVLLSRPLYREDVINGKIISSLALIVLTVAVTSFLSVSASILLQGITVTLDDIIRLCIFIIVSILFSFAYYAISLFVSVLSNRSGQSLVISLGVWIFFALILPLLASFIALTVLGPPPAFLNQNFTRGRTQLPQSFIDYQRKSAQISSAVQIVSVNNHYSSLASSLFGLRVLFGQEQNVDVLSLLYTHWIDIVILIIYPIVFLLASYMVFTGRQEK